MAGRPECMAGVASWRDVHALTSQPSFPRLSPCLGSATCLAVAQCCSPGRLYLKNHQGERSKQNYCLQIF